MFFIFILMMGASEELTNNCELLSSSLTMINYNKNVELLKVLIRVFVLLQI